VTLDQTNSPSGDLIPAFAGQALLVAAVSPNAILGMVARLFGIVYGLKAKEFASSGFMEPHLESLRKLYLGGIIVCSLCLSLLRCLLFRYERS
jgi:hypothetical protein